MIESYRCIIAGDGGVGKTTLVSKICTNHLLQDYIPTILDLYETIVLSQNNTMIKLQFLDLPGQEDYNKIREFSYQDPTDLIILCFSTISKNSYRNISDFWLKEIKKIRNLNGVPILLVGTQMKERNLLIETEQLNINNHVLEIEGEKLAKALGGIYLECDSFNNHNIDQLKETMASVITISKQIDSTKIKSKIKSKK